MKRLAVLVVVLLAALPLTSQTIVSTVQPKSVDDTTDPRRSTEAGAQRSVMMQDNQVSALDRAKALLVLAAAYQDEGNFQLAAKNFDLASHLLRGAPDATREYAMALNAFSSLYRDMGNMVAAESLGKRALQYFQMTDDSAGVARACEGLAEDALGRMNLKEGQIHIACAEHQSQSTPDLPKDFEIALLTTEGWLAELQLSPGVAVSKYQRALMLRILEKGSKSASAGWGYLLLGKAQVETGKRDTGLRTLRSGLAILKESVGENHVKYLVAEVAYEQLSAKSSSTTSEARKKLQRLYRDQCTQCRISFEAMR